MLSQLLRCSVPIGCLVMCLRQFKSAQQQLFPATLTANMVALSLPHNQTSPITFYLLLFPAIIPTLCRRVSLNPLPSTETVQQLLSMSSSLRDGFRNAWNRCVQLLLTTQPQSYNRKPLCFSIAVSPLFLKVLATNGGTRLSTVRGLAIL